MKTFDHGGILSNELLLVPNLFDYIVGSELKHDDVRVGVHGEVVLFERPVDWVGVGLRLGDTGAGYP